jgi:phosphate/sulfate permease
MSTTLVVLITVAGLYVGGNIGANDAANCIGPAVGARLIRYRTAITMLAVFVILGALLQGGAVTRTVGKGIVTVPISPLGVLSGLLCGGLFVSLATFFKVPVSTSQAIVGAVAGVGIAADLHIDASKLVTIVECWVLCPLLSMALAFGIYRATRFTMRRIKWARRASRVLNWLVLTTSAYSAYSLGANNLGNAIGPIFSLGDCPIDMRILVVAGALSMAVGALVFGRGVAETVGKSIIPLDLHSAFAVQVSAAFGLHLFSMLGIPVSTSQAIVGALLGIGLVHGIKTVSRRKIYEVLIGWVAAPLFSGLVSFLLYKELSGPG